MKKLLSFVLAAIMVLVSMPLVCTAADATTVVDGIIYSADMKKLIKCTENYSGGEEYKIPNGVEEICDDAFRNNQVISHISIAPSVKRIGKNAFRNSILWSVSFYRINYSVSCNLETIDDCAFMDCKKLYKVNFYLQDSFAFGENVFTNCTELVSINVPNVDVPESTFIGCSKLKYIGTGPSEYVVTMFRIGFMDSNGNVTASCARDILRLAAKVGFKVQNAHLAADVDRDGKITASDARKTLRVAAKLETF